MKAYEWWSLLGTWLASIGTIASVIVSLWLANKNNTINLNSNLLILISPPNIEKEYIGFYIINTGQLPVTITSINWLVYKKYNILSKYFFYPQILFTKWFYRFIKNDLFTAIQMFKGDLTSNLPKILKYGEYAYFTYPY